MDLSDLKKVVLKSLRDEVRETEIRLGGGTCSDMGEVGKAVGRIAGLKKAEDLFKEAYAKTVNEEEDDE